MSQTPPPTPASQPSARHDGGIFHLQELSFKEIEGLDRERSVVLFTVSPLEEHGPHLPTGTDIYTADFFCAELGNRIVREKPGWTVLIGPPLPIGASAFDRAGTLLARARTVRNATLDYGASLARHGFRYILVTNGHAGPRHVVALEEAAASVSRRYAVRMLSLSGLVLWKFMRGRYTERLEALLGRSFTAAEREMIHGDTHGGLWETSLLLLIRPDLVKPVYASLPSAKFTLLEALRKNYPLRLGNQMGYIGTPSAAQREFGEAARRLFGELLWEVVQPVFEAQDESWQQTSFLYKIPFFRTLFPHVVAGAALVLAGWAIVQWLK